MAKTDFSRYCTPAQLYLILAGISLLTAFFNNFEVITLVVNGIFVLIWGWILNWLCSKGLKAISWILVLLPFILFAFMFFFAKDVVREGNTNKPNKKFIQDKIDQMDKANAALANRSGARAARNANDPQRQKIYNK